MIGYNTPKLPRQVLMMTVCIKLMNSNELHIALKPLKNEKVSWSDDINVELIKALQILY